MARTPTRKMPPSGGQTHIEKVRVDEFARRLYKLMNEKGMSQSDLAREVWGDYVTPQGKVTAKNRDRISQYVRGNSFPDPKNLEALARALDCDVADLAPDIEADTIAREKPEVSMSVVSGHYDKVYLTVETVVPFDVAVEIAGLIDKAKRGTPS